MEHQLSQATCVRVNPELIVSQMENEVVMMSIERGSYYGLNPVASRIWQLLAKETSISEICEQLLLEYDVDADKCASEVARFITRMIDEGLVAVQEDAG